MKSLTEAETSTLLRGDLVWREDVRNALLNEIAWLSEYDKARVWFVIDSVPPAESHEIHNSAPDPRIWLMTDRDGNATTFTKQYQRIKELEKEVESLKEVIW